MTSIDAVADLIQRGSFSIRFDGPSPGRRVITPVVEAARRIYRRRAMAADRADKERVASSERGDAT